MKEVNVMHVHGQKKEKKISWNKREIELKDLLDKHSPKTESLTA